MNTCPACGSPLGDRAFAPRNGTAPCVTDFYPDLGYHVATQAITCVVCGEPSDTVECDACFDREDAAASRRADR